MHASRKFISHWCCNIPLFLYLPLGKQPWIELVYLFIKASDAEAKIIHHLRWKALSPLTFLKHRSIQLLGSSFIGKMLWVWGKTQASTSDTTANVGFTFTTSFEPESRNFPFRVHHIHNWMLCVWSSPCKEHRFTWAFHLVRISRQLHALIEGVKGKWQCFDNRNPTMGSTGVELKAHSAFQGSLGPGQLVSYIVVSVPGSYSMLCLYITITCSVPTSFLWFTSSSFGFHVSHSHPHGAFHLRSLHSVQLWISCLGMEHPVTWFRAGWWW